jgi:hypothetical protein
MLFPDRVWMQCLDAASGKQLWWLNGTATIINALLNFDGTLLYLAYYNASISVVDMATGSVVDHWSLASVMTPSADYSGTSTHMSVGRPIMGTHNRHYDDRH